MIPEDKMQELKQLRKKLQACTRCELRKHYDKPVACVGSPIAKVMFIGEAPGADEVEQGKPFVGISGQILRAAILEANLDLEDVFITNVISCRPLNNKFPDNMEYINACRFWLQQQFELVQPQIVVSVGGKAHKYIRQSDVGITKACGQWEKYSFVFNNGSEYVSYPAWYIPTLHPSFCLRGPDTRYPNPVMQLDSEGKKNLLKSHIALIPSKLEEINNE